MILFKKIDATDRGEVEQAKAVAAAKRGKHHKGYIQYHAGDHTLDIPNLATANGQIRAISPEYLNGFFGRIDGRFLERDAQYAKQNGRGDTSADFREMFDF